MKKKTKNSSLAIILRKNAVPILITTVLTLLVALYIFKYNQQSIASLRMAKEANAYGTFGSQPIKKYNNHYLVDTTGKPVYFTGYYSWAAINPDSYVDHPSKYKDMIELMAENNLDYMRLELGMNRLVHDEGVLSFDSPAIFEYDTSVGDRYPTAKANLDQFDARFFSGMDNIIQYATSRKINVHLAIFDGVNIAYGRGENDSGPGQCTDPFTSSFYRWCNSAWNINNQTRSFFGQIDKTPLGGTDFDGDFYQYKTDASGNPYLDSTPGTLNFYQRKVIAEIINKTRHYNNVFYEVGNEMFNQNTTQSKAWHQAVVSYAKSVAPDKVITANYKLDSSQDWGNFDALARHDGDQATDILKAVEESFSKNNPIIMDPDGSQLKGVDVVMTRREGGVVRFEDELRKAAWYAFIARGAGWGGFTHDWWDYNPNYDDSCQCVRVPGLTQPGERIAEIKKDAAMGNELAVEIINIPKFYGYLKKFINESNTEFWNMTPKSYSQDYQNYNNRALEQNGKAIIGFVNYGDSVTLDTSAQGSYLLLKYYNPITGVWTTQQRIANSGSLDLSSPFSNQDPEKRDWAFVIQTEGSSSNPVVTPTPIPTNTPVPSPTGTTNRTPIGTFNSIVSGSYNTYSINASGIVDPDNSQSPVTVSIYDNAVLVKSVATNNINETFSNISAGQHTIKITARDNQTSQEVELTGSPKVVTVQNPPTTTLQPAVVSNLQYVCNATGDQVTIAWSPSANASGYWIRSDRQSDPWTDTCPLSSVTGSDLCIGTSSTNSYSQTTYTMAVTPYSSYNTWIHAVNANGVSQPTAMGFKCIPQIVSTPVPTPTISPTPVPTKTPVPTPIITATPTAMPTNSTSSNIVIYAAGQPAKGIWPQLGVTIIGENNGDIINITSRDLKAYSYTPRQQLSISRFQFNFINDYYERQYDSSGNFIGTIDRNLRINKVIQNGVEYYTSDTSTYSLGSAAGSRACSAAGFFKTEWLRCQWGYFRFNQK